MRLQEYFAACLVRRGLLLFERAFSEHVKEALRSRFLSDDGSDAAVKYERELRDYREAEAKKENWEQRVALLGVQVFERTETAKKAPEDQKSESWEGVSQARKELKALKAKKPTVPAEPCPVWLQHAHSVLGKVSKAYAKEKCRWDTFTLVMVMKGFLEEVFVPHFGIDQRPDADQRGNLLLSSLTHLMEARTLRAHGIVPSEGEALVLLNNIRAVLVSCSGSTGKVLEGESAEATALLEEAQALVEEARQEPGRERRIILSAEEYRALVLYRAMHEFEQQLEREVGPFQYKDQTIAFGQVALKWTSADQELVKEQAENLKKIAPARHWLFHHSKEAPDEGVLTLLGAVPAALRGIAARNAQSPAAAPAATPPAVAATAPAAPTAPAAHFDDPAPAWEWAWPTAEEIAAGVAVQLTLSASGMRIPTAAERCLVGRAEVIEEIVDSLLAGSTARVLVHGPPGVGKDVVAAEVVRSDRVARMAGVGLQEWLHATTDDMLRQQLVEKFGLQYPKVVQGAGEKQEDQLAAIRAWLQRHNEWLLVVEDASWETRALWDYIPADTGRLLVTSQSPLCSVDPERVERTPLVAQPFLLGTLAVEESLELLRKMKPFDGEALKISVGPCGTEAELRSVCDAHGAGEVYCAPTNGETNAQRMQRRSRIVAHLEDLHLHRECAKTDGRVPYSGPRAREKSDAAEQRRRGLRAALQLDSELQHEGLSAFLEEELGNLPLSVALCGQMLRKIGSVEGLMAQFRELDLHEVDEQGRNPLTYRHYLGLKRSVRLALLRLQASEEEQGEAGGCAERLLCVLSRIPGAAIPAALFKNDRRLQVLPLTTMDSDNRLERREDAGDGGVFDAALKTLEAYGLVKESADPQQVVVAHQLVQRVVREVLLAPGTFDRLEDRSCNALALRLSTSNIAEHHADLRAIHHSAERWCQLCCPRRERSLAELRLRTVVATTFVTLGYGAAAIAWAGDALRLLEESHPNVVEPILDAKAALGNAYCAAGRPEDALPHLTAVLDHHEAMGLASRNYAAAMGSLASAHEAMGAPQQALPLQRRMFDMYVRLRPPVEEITLALAMGSLASTYNLMGRLTDALPLEEEALQILQRRLPPRHLTIAQAMGNLAATLGALGRYADALPYEVQVLELRRHFLPDEHLYVALAMSNLAFSLRWLDKPAEALPLDKRALAIYRALLPPEHLSVARAMGNLGATLGELEMHEEALQLKEDALAMFRRLLPPPPVHIEVARAMANLAGTHLDLGNLLEALRLGKESLTAYQALLPEDHPDIPHAMENLAATHSLLHRHAAAARLLEEALRLCRLHLHPPDRIAAVQLQLHMANTAAVMAWATGGARR